MPSPFTTPVAQSVPFEANRNPGFGGVPSEIMSTNVQDAIEEAKNDALNNDRYLVLGSYNGNANTGRYLEFFPNIDSSVAPIYLPVSSRLLTVVAAGAAATTCQIAFFNLTISSVTPVYTVTFTSEQRKTLVTTPTAPFYVFPADAQVAVRVTSGSISKPYLYFFLSADT